VITKEKSLLANQLKLVNNIKQVVRVPDFLSMLGMNYFTVSGSFSLTCLL